MSGQTFRENIEQEVHYIIYATDGDTEDLITELVDWVVGRFGPEVASDENVNRAIAYLCEAADVHDPLAIKVLRILDVQPYASWPVGN